MIIPHVAIRLKPVNEPKVSCRTTRLAPDAFFPNAVEGTGAAAATICHESPANACIGATLALD
jgi:hypothetical protein